MNQVAAGGNRLEVYRYVWPLHIWILVWSGLLAFSAAFTILFDSDLRESAGGTAFSLAAGLGIYGAAVGCAYFLKDKFEGFRRLSASPSLVADKDGIKTPWSLGSPLPRIMLWKEIRGFGIGTRYVNSDEPYEGKFPCVFVAEIKRYRRWFALTMYKWKPDYALPLPYSYTFGYLVRCDPLEPRDNVDDLNLVRLLSEFKFDLETLGASGGLRLAGTAARRLPLA